MYPDYKELVWTVPIVLYYHPVCYHNTGRSLKYNYASRGHLEELFAVPCWLLT